MAWLGLGPLGVTRPRAALASAGLVFWAVGHGVAVAPVVGPPGRPVVDVGVRLARSGCSSYGDRRRDRLVLLLLATDPRPIGTPPRRSPRGRPTPTTSRPQAAWPGARPVGGFFLVMGGVHLGPAASPSTETSPTTPSSGSSERVARRLHGRSGWALLLMAGEITLGRLPLVGGRGSGRLDRRDPLPRAADAVRMVGLGLVDSPWSSSPCGGARLPGRRTRGERVMTSPTGGRHCPCATGYSAAPLRRDGLGRGDDGRAPPAPARRPGGRDARIPVSRWRVGRAAADQQFFSPGCPHRQVREPGDQRDPEPGGDQRGPGVPLGRAVRHDRGEAGVAGRSSQQALAGRLAGRRMQGSVDQLARRAPLGSGGQRGRPARSSGSSTRNRCSNRVGARRQAWRGDDHGEVDLVGEQQLEADLPVRLGDLHPAARTHAVTSATTGGSRAAAAVDKPASRSSPAPPRRRRPRRRPGLSPSGRVSCSGAGEQGARGDGEPEPAAVGHDQLLPRRGPGQGPLDARPPRGCSCRSSGPRRWCRTRPPRAVCGVVDRSCNEIARRRAGSCAFPRWRTARSSCRVHTIDPLLQPFEP